LKDRLIGAPQFLHTAIAYNGSNTIQVKQRLMFVFRLPVIFKPKFMSLIIRIHDYTHFDLVE